MEQMRKRAAIDKGTMNGETGRTSSETSRTMCQAVEASDSSRHGGHLVSELTLNTAKCIGPVVRWLAVFCKAFEEEEEEKKSK